jgi:uncharacterized protein YndB with AHSA1/START domain
MSESTSGPMMRRHRLAAPVDVVRAALTDSAALRSWFAEYAEVELPSRFEFWGRHTPGGDVPRQRLLHVDDSTVRFSWLLDGVDTTVDIGLVADVDGSTVLTLAQKNLPGFQEMLAQETALGQMYTFWALSIANLADHVEGRRVGPKCDFTSPVQRAELDIDAPPRAVFDSIADPAVFSRWFGAKVEAEQSVGGRWSMGELESNPSPCHIVDLEPGRLLSIAWPDGMVSSWELAGSGGGTRLTFVQSGFDESTPPYTGWMGWLGSLAELRRFHEVADWRPSWLQVHLDGLAVVDTA